MPNTENEALQARAYGPDQPPLTDSERARLQCLQDDPREMSLSETRPRRASRRSVRLLWALATVGLAGSAAGVGFAAGNASAGESAEPSTLGDGIQLADGEFRAFGEADCSPVLSVQDGSLAGVDCVWGDGRSVSFGTDGSVSSEVIAVSTRGEETWGAR